MNAAPVVTVTTDHLDLLVSAALRYRVLVSATAAAFSAGTSRAGTVATPTEAGWLLLEQYLSAIRWGTGTGPPAGVDYQHRQVHRFEPIEVVKAAHCLQHLCQDSPSWAGSAAARLLEAILRGATERLPGYAQAAWHWTRPAAPTGEPVGLSRTWKPIETGVRWLTTPGELAQAWDNASLVLLPVDVLELLPADLPQRPGVYACVAGAVEPEVWVALEELQPDAVIVLPTGRRWLLEQLHDPAGAYRRSRLYPGSLLPAS